MYIIFYDISDPVRLKRVAKLLQRYGRRIQKSVFECDITEYRYHELLAKLNRIRAETDRISCCRNGKLTELHFNIVKKKQEPDLQKRINRV